MTASNLVLSYQSIPLDAIARKASVTFDTDLLEGNLVTGERYAWGSATAGASGTIDYEFDLGTGNTGTCDHVVAARADKLQTQGTTTFKLSTAPDGIAGTYSDVWTDAGIAAATLYGPKSQDYFALSLGLAGARTWRWRITGGASTNRAYSKFHFGTIWDPACNPHFGPNREPFQGTFESGSGVVYPQRMSSPKYKFDITWGKVSTALTNTFLNRVVRKADLQRFFLITTAQHQILDQKRIVHVKLVPNSFKHSRILNDYNSITASFEEVTG